MSVHRLPTFPAHRHHVYAMFCQDGDGPGYVKFGRSRQIGKRMTALKTGCPIPARMFAVVDTDCEQDAIDLERELHKHFADRNSQGEWFRFDFSAEEDKRAFNDGCRAMFLFVFGAGDTRWWTKINIAALEEHQKQKQRNILRNRKLFKKVVNRQLKLDRQRKAWKELDTFGRTG